MKSRVGNTQLTNGNFSDVEMSSTRDEVPRQRRQFLYWKWRSSCKRVRECVSLRSWIALTFPQYCHVLKELKGQGGKLGAVHRHVRLHVNTEPRRICVPSFQAHVYVNPAAANRLYLPKDYSIYFFFLFFAKRFWTHVYICTEVLLISELISRCKMCKIDKKKRVYVNIVNNIL